MKFQLVLAVIPLLLLQKKLVAKSDSNFTIQVLLHSWHNPRNTLKNGSACCDVQNSSKPCCNSRFIFYSSCGIRNSTTRITASGKYEHEESGNITFGTLNGTNPFVRHNEGELAITVMDVNPNGSNSVIDDMICITIPTMLVNLTDPVKLNGSWDHILIFSYNVTCAQGYYGPNCSAEQDLPYTPMDSGSSNSQSIIGGVIGCTTVTMIIIGVLVTYTVLTKCKRVGTNRGEECIDTDCRFSPGDNHSYSGAMGSHITETPKQIQAPDTKFGTLSCHEYECTDFVVNKSNTDYNTNGVYEATYATIDSPAEHEEESLPPQSEHYCFRGGIIHAPQIYDSDDCVAFPDPESDGESDGFEHPMPKQQEDLGDYPTLIRTESALNTPLMEQKPAYIPTTK